MKYPRIVGTDCLDGVAFPLDFKVAHATGAIHRGVHVEIACDDRILVMTRQDGRLELLGGHVDWLDTENRAETAEEAGVREILEELIVDNWSSIPEVDRTSRIRGRLSFVAKVMNQLPSRSGYNNEFVTCFRLNWNNDWGDPESFTLGEEGNHSPRWVALAELKTVAEADPQKLNAALKLFLARQGIMVPITPQ